MKKIGLIQGQHKAYSEINSMLIGEGKNVSNFPGMPEISNKNFEEQDEVSYERALQLGAVQYAKLNEEQKIIIDTVLNSLDCVDNFKTTCFYIDGPGGSGKTFVYTTLCYLLKGKKKQVCSMAFTGIAATLQ